MLPRRDLQTDPIHPQPQTQDANIDSRTRIQELFNMPIETFLRELKPNRGWLVIALLPLASMAKIFNWHPTIALAVDITAIILLSEMISISSNELATYLGELQGALLSATFGNTVELTVSFKVSFEYLNDTMLIKARLEFWPWFMARSHSHSLSWLAASSQISCL